jgi:molybdopterin-guanine dinucleotide biosynthesis protein B
VTVVGYSDSGKTTVVSSLIRKLTDDGYRIASVKHSPHGHDSDRPGSDTDRQREAGAALVVASSPGKLTAIERVDGDTPLESIVASIGEGIDIVVAEGFKASGYHKVLVSDGLPVPENVDNVIATVGRAAHIQGVPEFDLDTLHLLAETVVDRFLR